MSEFTPGVYAKGDDKRVADNIRQAVALEFEGYRRLPVEKQPDEVPEGQGPGVSETAATPDVPPTDTPADPTPDVDDVPSPRSVFGSNPTF